MLTKILSVASIGLKSQEVEVEVDVAEKGLPGVTIVGLPSKAIEESRERVKTAINNSGGTFPAKKITINLAPADLPKEGSCYDLPMAVGILAASGEVEVKKEMLASFFYGELSLDGSLRHTRGSLLVALLAKKRGVSRIYVPKVSAAEAAAVEGVEVVGVSSLLELVAIMLGQKQAEIVKPREVAGEEEREVDFDMAEVIGQESAKRAMVIAAAGGHNIIMSGPPGSGKTLLSRALPGILPPLEPEEALEVTKIYSVAGLIDPGKGLVDVRPFRSPHHTTSAVGIIGGGSIPMPGEVSLAHLGVLFLDEMAEFSKFVLEVLRQPMEDGKVSISRAAGRVDFPAEFMLVAAVNPCPCGWLGHPKRECRCSPFQVIKYKRKISGPILDRIDLQVRVEAVEIEKLTREGVSGGEDSKTLRGRVVSARKIQLKRFTGEKQLWCNARMNNRQIKKFCQLKPEAMRILKLAAEKFDMSARSYFRVIKVARTISDLSGHTDIEMVDVAEALQYRMSDI